MPRGLNKTEKKEVKTIVSRKINRMTELKQHRVVADYVELYDGPNGGNFWCLSDVPLEEFNQTGANANTNDTRLGNKISPKSITVDVMLRGSRDTATFNGKVIDELRVVLFRYKNTTHPQTTPPSQGLLWGETGPPLTYDVMTKPLNTFGDKDFEILEDRKIRLTGSADQYQSGLTHVTKVNSPQNKDKLLRLRVNFKDIVKSLNFVDSGAGIVHSEHRNSYWLYVVRDNNTYGSPIDLNLPYVSLYSRFNYHDIGS